MNILITGGTGFVGTALVKQLTQQNHRVIISSRREKQGREDIRYTKTPGEGELFSVESIAQADAVINLAGHNIAAGRWTAQVKDLILNSRVQITRRLVRSMERNKEVGQHYPKVLLNASAVGYYGQHPTATFDEESPNGEGFLAGVCRQWEQEAQQAEGLGARVARFRFGIVLGPGGGVLERIKMPYKFGMGGYIGDGKQWVSWIHIEDLVNILTLALTDERVMGAVNLCSPQPVTMAELDRHLARVLGKTSWTRLPGLVARTLLGEMADELLLNGQQVMPKKLITMQVPFKYPDIASALAASA
ncbi:MAG: TIGR01777 family oxidoreductase [Bacillota bacterium]|nr:TIGR01777 family oxidoreductase [Bacillota bacterium]